MQTNRNSVKCINLLKDTYDVHIKFEEVKFCISVRKYHDVTLPENDAAVYTPCSLSHRRHILTPTCILLKFLQINIFDDGC